MLESAEIGHQILAAPGMADQAGVLGRRRGQRQQRQMQGERKQRDLSGDDRIVGMRKISVGPRGDQRLISQHDDARGPSRPERGKDPQPQALQHDEAGIGIGPCWRQQQVYRHRHMGARLEGDEAAE